MESILKCKKGKKLKRNNVEKDKSKNMQNLQKKITKMKNRETCKKE